jgi:hypothetical protein
MKKVFAFTGVAGTAVQDSLVRLQRRLRGEVLIVSIDNILWDLFAADARNSSALRRESELSEQDIIPGSKPNWWQLLTMPKGCILHYWRRAAQQASLTVKKSKADIVLLTFHARYQSDAYRWRFCPCDPVVLRRFHIKGFFSLIDDVYNVHRRRPADLGSEKQISLHQEDPWRRAQTLVHQTIESLSDLIHWRQEEISTTEDLASACEAPVHLFSIRHPLSTVVKLIENPNFAYYFSHPITAIRRDPKFPHVQALDEIIDISQRLRTQTTLIEPTAIDEYRFDSIELDGTKLFLPSLTQRWPYADNADELLGPPEKQETTVACEFLCPPENLKTPNVAEIFAQLRMKQNSGTPHEVQRAISETVKHFADVVGEDITWRDHALVDQCKRLIVFRPAYLGIPSTGVRRELEYYRKLNVSARALNKDQGEAPQTFNFIYHPPADEVALSKHIAVQIVQAWGADPSIGSHLRPLLRPGTEDDLVSRLAEVLASTPDIVSAASKCAALMADRVQPAVQDPAPMQQGKRAGVQERNREILALLRRTATTQIQALRYLPPMVADASLGVTISEDRFSLVRGVSSSEALRR